MNSPPGKLIAFILLLLTFTTLFGCTDTPPTPPYTTNQFVTKTTGIDINTFNSNGVNGMYLTADKNKIVWVNAGGGNATYGIDGGFANSVFANQQFGLDGGFSTSKSTPSQKITGGSAFS